MIISSPFSFSFHTLLHNVFLFSVLYNIILYSRTQKVFSFSGRKGLQYFLYDVGSGRTLEGRCTRRGDANRSARNCASHFRIHLHTRTTNKRQAYHNTRMQVST